MNYIKSVFLLALLGLFTACQKEPLDTQSIECAEKVDAFRNFTLGRGLTKAYILSGSNISTTDASFSGTITIEGNSLKLVDDSNDPSYDEAYFDLCLMIGYREIGANAVAIYF